MDKPILLMLNTWFDGDKTGPFYCPDCGIVEGLFAYNPEIRTKIDIIHMDFERPRHKIIQLLGDEHQGSPALVLDRTDPGIKGLKTSITTGKAFIDDPILICDYLAMRFGGVRPHPQ